MAGLQVHLCSRCRAAGIHPNRSNKRQRTSDKVFTCSHLLQAQATSSDDNTTATTVPSSSLGGAQQHLASFHNVQEEKKDSVHDSEVPDAAISGGALDDTTAADNNHAFDDAVAAVPVLQQNDDNNDDETSTIESDSFFEAPDPENPSNKVHMAFCCARCKCSGERRLKYGNKLSMQGQTQQGDEGYHHRHCCHKIWVEQVKEEWLSPHDEAVQKLEHLLEIHHGNVPLPSPKLVTLRDFVGVCPNFLRRDTTLRGLDQDVDGVSNLWANETYVANNKRFQEIREKRKDKRQPAVVLDMFGGIGGGIVALKRQGIAMKKVWCYLLLLLLMMNRCRSDRLLTTVRFSSWHCR